MTQRNYQSKRKKQLPHNLDIVDHLRDGHLRPKVWYRHGGVEFKEHKITTAKDVKGLRDWLDKVLDSI